ncbi:MAG TPA: T9SS type A sorting domain-containing protein, partial [Flavobacteriales bacterium]|nr:T9SS type A sorting domain-containing protein [Flavobacteriales bacterium]
ARNSRMKLILTSALSLTVALANAQTVKILFDASQAEMAGNADWVPDADTYNLGVNSTTHLMQTGSGNEANPQRYPTPAQSGITASTAQSYWKGALSNWAIDLVRQGYGVETLPYNGLITYGVTTNAQDLSNYKVFIVCEPNIRFSTSEKAALISFVQNGGGLFMIADHTVSDRNNDGWDSPAIWNDLMTGNPFGITFDLQNFSQTSTNVRVNAADPILHGSMGNVTGAIFHNGTSMTVSTAANATAKGLVYKTGASNTGNTLAIFAASNYGAGKVGALGDSSPPDDGSGDTNDALFSSYATDLSGSHRKLLVNATKWLVTPGTAAMPFSHPGLSTLKKMNASLGVDLWPNPSYDMVNVRFASDTDAPVTISIMDMTGRVVAQERVNNNTGVNVVPFNVQGFPEGLYVVHVNNGDTEFTERFVKN